MAFRAWCTLLLLALHGLHGAMAQTVTAGSTPGDDPVIQLGSKILTEAYKRLGYQLVITQVSGERSLIEANAGSVDGELLRREGLEVQYPNLLKVPFPITAIEFTAFSKQKISVAAGWPSLAPYGVGFMRGVKLIEDKTAGMQVEPVNTLEQSLRMLERDRIDIVVAGRLFGIRETKRLGFSNISALSPPLAVIPLFHYVHVSHSDWVPKLRKILESMAKDGTIKHLRDQVEAGQ